MKNFIMGVVALVITTTLVYVFLVVGWIVLSIAVAISLVAALMLWVASFFVLRKQGQSVFSSYSVSQEGKDGEIIDVEFSEVTHKNKQ